MMIKKSRITSLDFLRGLTILIMFVDHYVALAFDMDISVFNIRFFTRIAEPTFALLLGFFLFNRSNKSLAFRAIEIFFVALLINIFFYSVTNKFEVLVSFFLVYVVFILAKLFNIKFEFFVFAILFNKIDSTHIFLDYPITLVLSQVSFGYLIRQIYEKGNKISDVISLTLLFFLPIVVGILFVTSNSYMYTVFFTGLAAIILIIFFEFHNKLGTNIINRKSLRALSLIGEKPLLFYALQYILAVILAIPTYAYIH
ncbi:MAG: hypothetical protein N3E37_03485, partial [Candidatus Micrarchaeota archaeon]|nr:hypothetical protein [Candidatus Micrarchaeota archaeon]